MSTDAPTAELPASVKSYARYLLTMAGLGGLLYGIDVGVIAAALPYLKATTSYDASQLSLVVAAVLAGSVVSSLFAGMLAEIFGRKAIIIVSALLFVLSIPIIALSGENFGMLMGGRILQGASGGLIAVVIPMYLAECLSASARGKGTGMFQFLLTIGLAFAALIGLVVAYYVGGADDPLVAKTEKQFAWQAVFWGSMIPGIILFLGAFRLKESPRWLYLKGRKEEALSSLAANNGDAEAQRILNEMIEADAQAAKEKAELAANAKGESLLQRKYVIPFLLAVSVLACNQATGVNSMIAYCVDIFNQAGLDGSSANTADLILKLVNVGMTIVAVSLVDKKGRTFLLKMGTAGIIVGLAGVGFLFKSVEGKRIDVTEQVKAALAAQTAAAAKAEGSDKPKESFRLALNDLVLTAKPEGFIENGEAKADTQLVVTYTHGGDASMKVVNYKTKATVAKELAEGEKKAIEQAATAGLTPEKAVAEIQKSINDSTSFIVAESTFTPTFIDAMMFWKEAPQEGSVKGVEILKAELGQKPTATMGWMVTLCFCIFMAFFAAGPGVCVWLALSELMPSRIRANGMAIALLINQGVSTIIAGSFFPWVSNSGYSGVFFWLAGFTVIYFIIAAFLLPETKGRSLEEIEEYFTTGKMPEGKAPAAES